MAIPGLFLGGRALELEQAERRELVCPTEPARIASSCPTGQDPPGGIWAGLQQVDAIPAVGTGPRGWRGAALRLLELERAAPRNKREWHDVATCTLFGAGADVRNRGAGCHGWKWGRILQLRQMRR